MENCYQLAPESDSPRLRREFEPPAFDAWLERLSDQGLCQLLVSLVLKLERMMRAPLDGSQILAILRRLTVMIRDVADDLPKRPPPRPTARDPAAGLSLEQRLGCATYKNLKRSLELLDRSADGSHDRDAARAWLVGEMFACLGRQIELGVILGNLWPAGTWQELHDLFFYFTNRMAEDPASSESSTVIIPAGYPGSSGNSASKPSLDAETAYKRLLLVGLCAQHQATELLAPDQAERLTGWARESKLADPGLYFGVLGTYLIEVTGDAPPRLVPGALGSVSSAWVLSLPTALLAALPSAPIGQRRIATR
jgi:hypothetical protein